MTSTWEPGSGVVSRPEFQDRKRQLVWPDRKDFAFTVFDDTDLSTIENAKAVYDFLGERGFRTTKSVWPLHAAEVGGGSEADGANCEDLAYLEWVLGLQASGFEIGLHNVASQSSRRDRTRRGLERFRLLFGAEPITYSTHLTNAEGMYFGSDRLSGSRRTLYRLYGWTLRNTRFRGHIEGDEFFWGDLCRSNVKYVRNFVFPDINTAKVCPEMPYHDPERPFVNYWFASSEGAHVDTFVRTISEENQDRLAAERGACIMYTHFACGFATRSGLDPRFERQMRRLAGMNGYFVPVRTLLDHILAVRGHHELTPAERRRLEWRWLQHKARVGRT